MNIRSESGYSSFSDHALRSLVIIFLFAGVVWHDPWWKNGEAYSFGIIYHFYTTHTWLVPMDAGAPFLEKPPLYYWTSVIFCHLLGGVLSLPDAARMASIFYTVITLIFSHKTAKLLLREKPNAGTLVKINMELLLTTYGLMHMSHTLLTDNALVTGTPVTLYGMALLMREPASWRKAGFWIGVGIGIAFMTKGLFMPVVLVITAIILICLLPALRSGATLRAVLTAFISALPFLTIWPMLLYRDSPILFKQWLWDNNIGRFLGFSVAQLGAANDRVRFVELLFTASFPLLPFALLEVWHARKDWKKTEYILPITVISSGIALLMISASCRAPYFIPLIPPMAILATQTFAQLKERACLHLNLILSIAFSISIALAWGTWWSLSQLPWHQEMVWLPHIFGRWIKQDFNPPEISKFAVVIAAISTVIWGAFLPMQRTIALYTARIWCIGALSLWIVVYTLMMPWINETKSLRPILARASDFINHSPYHGSCVGNYQLGENIAPLFVYFEGKKDPLPIMDLRGHECSLLLTFALQQSSPEIAPEWKLVWSDARFSDIRDMELRLYARK